MSVRKRLGLPTDALVLSFIGRLDAVKGTEKLIPILTALSNRRRVSLVVIGDGPDRISLESSTRSDSLVMTGALAPEMAAPWLYAADIMVLPGQVGLAVNHAFAYGLPVVVRDSPHSGRYHSPEIQFVRNGSNAEVAVGGSVDAFIEAIERVALDLDRYSQNALRAAETELSPEIMIDGMLAAIREVERLD